MRICAALLAIILILLQGRLWFGDKGLHEVSGLKASVETQRAANLEQTERNRQLSAEVANLKTGLTALEERARSDHSSTLFPNSEVYCFGMPRPAAAAKRSPRPAAGTMAQRRRAARPLIARGR